MIYKASFSFAEYCSTFGTLKHRIDVDIVLNRFNPWEDLKKNKYFNVKPQLKLTAVSVFFLMCAFLHGQENGDSSYVVNFPMYEDSLYEEQEYVIHRVRFVDVSFSIHRPAASFAEKVDQAAFFGGSGAYLYQVQKEKPAFIGGEVSYAHLGSLTRTYLQTVSGEDIDITGRMSSNTLLFTGLFRYYSQWKLGPLEPYLEGQFGVKWLYTYFSENGFFANDDEYSQFDYVSGSTALTYGGAIGIQTRINGQFYLNLKANYQSAVSSTYYMRLKDDDNEFPLLPGDGFEEVKSATDAFRFDFGVTYVY